MVELYYSNSSGNTTFSKNPSDSKGGVITSQKISGGINNLFGTIAQKDIDYGKIDYRCIFIKNTSQSKDVKNLKLWIQQAITKDYYAYNVVFNTNYQNSLFNCKFGNISGWNLIEYPVLYFKYYANSCTVYKNDYDRNHEINVIAQFETSIGNNTIIELNNSGFSGTITVNSISLENNEVFQVVKSNVSSYFDPVNIDPLPNVDDSYIIPANAMGEWKGYDSYIARWTGYKWEISIDDFATFEFGIETPENNTVQTLNDVFQQPFGVDFVPAKSLQTAFAIDLLPKNSNIALWIKRIVNKRNIIEKDFDKLSIPVNHTIAFNQEYSMFFDYFEMNSYKITYSKETSFVKQTLQSLDFTVKINEIGELNYTNLAITLRIKYLSDFDSSKANFKASFMSVTYNDIQILDYFADFATTSNFSQTLNLLGQFLESGIYELYLDLIDLSNNNNVINTNSFTFTILDE